MPAIVEISALGTCPVRCSYCPQDKLGEAYSGPEYLTPEVFERCLDHLEPADAIYFAGFTEPCLNPDFMNLLVMALLRGHRTQLWTTGRGLKVEDARRVAGMNLDAVALHLPDADGGMGSSPATVPALAALAKHPRAMAMFMGSPHPEVQGIYESIPHGSPRMHDRAGSLTPGTTPAKPWAVHHLGAVRCGVAPLLDHPALIPDGRLILCCMDYRLAHVVGNLAENSLADILAGEPIRAILKAQRSDEDVACRHCVCAVPA